MGHTEYGQNLRSFESIECTQYMEYKIFIQLLKEEVTFPHRSQFIPNHCSNISKTVIMYLPYFPVNVVFSQVFPLACVEAGILHHGRIPAN